MPLDQLERRHPVVLNSDWMVALDQLIERHGEERALRLAGNDSVASRFLNADWMAALDQLIERHGEERALRLAGHGSVAASRLLNSDDGRDKV